MKNFAVFKVGSSQYIGEEGTVLVVDKLLAKEKTKVIFPEVLFFAKDEDNVLLGSPYIKGASVEAEVLEQGKGEKIRVARFRAKSRYRKVTGFRPQLSKIKITQIKIPKN